MSDTLIVPAPSGGLWRPATSLCRRELVRFLRQRSRVIGSLATPILFWAGIGLGMRRSFAGGDFLEYFFAGTVLMILLFTAIFSTISVIEDRREGFMQSVLVAPVPRAGVVLGKVLGGTVLASGQSVLFLLLAPTVGIHPGLLGYLGAVAMIIVLSFSLTCLGFCIAWRMASTQGFHVIMNLFLMPMWMFSGALFPIAGAALVMRWVMRANPLTYGLAGLRDCLYGGRIASPISFTTAVIVSVVFAAVLFFAADRIARRPVSVDLL